MSGSITDADQSINCIENEGGSDDEGQLSWKEKYDLQEKQMERIRQQTSKVRELLQIKVSKSIFITNL